MPYTDKPQNVLKELSSAQPPYPIYILTGEEEYFTDKIEKKILSTYMPDESVWDFDYTLLYGSSTSVDEVLAHTRRYPMGGERTLVVVREAQPLLRGCGGAKASQSDEDGDGSEGGSGNLLLDALAAMTKRLNPQNILVLCIKGGKRISRRLKAMKAIEQVGLVVESPAIRDYQIDTYIPPLAAEHGLRLATPSIKLIAERIGTDLLRMDSEFEKLHTSLTPEDRKGVTPEMILKYTSINKEYSVFDLRSSLARRDRGRSVMIAMSLAEDEKRTPVQMLLPVLFDYYAQLFCTFYVPMPRSQSQVMKHLGITSSFFVKDYMSGLAHYKPGKVMHIIRYLRKCDARSKGMYSTEGGSAEILMDLVTFILS